MAGTEGQRNREKVNFKKEYQEIFLRAAIDEKMREDDGLCATGMCYICLSLNLHDPLRNRHC